jgi:hypothetical protein
MRPKLLFSLFLIAMLTLCACGKVEGTGDTSSPAPSSADEKSNTPDTAETPKDENTIVAQIGDSMLTIKLEDNSSAQALKDLLASGPLILEMHDYSNFEKVGELGTSLPQNNESITTEPGDVILYKGTSITIYYDVNTWNFTRLGKVQNLTQQELKAILAGKDVTVTFSLGY